MPAPSKHPLSLTLRNVGYDFRHDADFLIDRPHGSGDYLLIHFTTPILIRDRQGKHVMPTGTCILYAPGFPQWYRGQEDGFANDWCHFTGPSVSELIKRCGITVNQAVHPAHFEPVAPRIRELEREFLRREPHWKEACAALLAQLLVAMARGMEASAKASLTPRMAELGATFRDLRSKVHADLEHAWTVEEMARLVHLSPSRFARLYQTFFGASPVDDLIGARVAHASWLLSSGTIFVKQAAAESGFSDVHYFSRCFRARVGCAPRDYRQRWLASLQEQSKQLS
ncbi:MAG TPA: AraC family transcriptional regulator [Planctomycetota bacterium]|jgi:AraC family transcriptional regulator of arabinose operon